jgi:hypothetical protein
MIFRDEPAHAEYLDAIRGHVCSRCVERPPEGPPCLPHGKVCGIELHLPRLLETVQRAHSVSIGPYLDRLHADVCAPCPHLGKECCRCPMDHLAVLLIEAIETVDRAFEQRDLERMLEETGGGD